MIPNKLLLLISVFICCIFLIGNVSAELDQITGMKIAETEITMDVGDLHTFKPNYSTIEVTGNYDIELHIFSSDDSVVRPVEKINPKELKDLSPEDYYKVVSNTLNTIEAVGGGTATVMLYSDNYEFSDVCTVKVNGPAVESKAKGAWNGPTAEQMKKVKDPALKAYFTMLDLPEMESSASELAKKESFKTLVTVTPGSQDKLAAKFEKLGMDPVYAFTEINMISVQGTPEQYLHLLEENDVLSIKEDKKFSVGASDISFLEGNAEYLVNAEKARTVGLTGAGQTIVIIDTGINPSHDMFTLKNKGKIILQACFSSENISNGIYYSCKNGTGQDLTSAAVGSQVLNPADFKHGVHVAGIAAGVVGVAPEANIIAINIFSEVWRNTSNGVYHGATTFLSDELRGLAYLMQRLGSSGRNVKVGGKNYPVAVVNFSIGDEMDHPGTCDNEAETPYTKKLLNRGIITVAASGNQSYTGYMNAPACISSVFAVGALGDSSIPTVASFSNHSSLVNILAPGENIVSSIIEASDPYANDWFGALDGTSMATPMVSGAIAMLRQGYPQLTASQIKTMLTKMSPLSASRSGISTKGLNFNNITTYNNVLKPAISVGGKNNAIIMSIPVGKKYKFSPSIKLYGCNNKRKNCKQITKFSKKISKKKNSTTITINGLTNYKVYKVVISGTAKISGTKYNINQQTQYGMPMTYSYKKGKATANGVNLSWPANAKIKKHQVYIYNTINGKKTGSPGWTATLSTKKFKTGVRLSGLPSGTKYYLMIRPVIKRSGKNYYGVWKGGYFKTTGRRASSISDPSTDVPMPELIAEPF